MKQPSDRTRVLIGQLQTLQAENKERFRSWERPDILKAIDLIELISDKGEWPAAIYLLSSVNSSENAIAESACDGIENLLAGMRPSLLLQLDAVIRNGLYSLRPYLSGWDAMKASDLNKLAANTNRIGVLKMASFHRDGYVREAALQALLSLDNGKELPALLIRLSDWVPEIRLLAEQAVEQRIIPRYLGYFIDNLALLELVAQRKRDVSIAKRSKIIGRIKSSLKQSQNQNLLLDGLTHEDYAVRRLCLNLMLDSQETNWAEIISRIIADRDLCIRRSAVELSTRLTAKEQLSTLRFLAKDKAPSIRRAALGALCELINDKGKELLKSALIDRSAIVRDYARWKLTELDGEFRFREFYLEQLSCGKAGRIVAASAMGLGEVGIPIDAQVIHNFVDHPEGRVRKGAIYALSKLAAASYVPVFLRVLGSDMPCVSQEAQHALERTLSIVRSDSLWEIFTISTKWYAKRNVLHLINRINKWDRICYLLLAASQDDPRMRELAMEFIASWERQYRTTWQYTKPNQEQQEKFVSGMLLVEKILPDQLGKTLGSCLQACHGK